jgi:hypothetical protein
MEEEEYRPLKKGSRVDDGYQPDSGYDDPYLRDENGRPVDFLKRGRGQRPRRNVPEHTGIRRYAIIGAVFSAVLAASGEVLAAAVVAASTFVVVMVVRWRR